MEEKIAVISVLYENYIILKDFIASFNIQTNSHFHIFLSDQSTHRKQINLPHYISLTQAQNKGYAAGINQEIRHAMKQEYTLFCVINSDTYVQKDFIESVLTRFKKNPHSLFGGKILYAPSYEYHKKIYKKEDLGKVLWYAGGWIDWDNVIANHRGVDDVDKGQYDSFEQTHFVTGCLMCFDKKVITHIGYLDESYFLYYEDADFCERAKRKGILLYYDPEIVIWHKNAQSTEGSGSKIHVQYQEKNRLRFGLKYAPFRTKLHLIKNYFI
jgi:hypothetical protein